MYLVSSPAHQPLAVFHTYESAETYLLRLENVSRKYSCAEDIAGSTISRIFVEKYDHNNPERTLGFIRAGVQIEPSL